MSSLTADASRLVAFGLRPKLLPSRDEEYVTLVRRYRDDDLFAESVRAVCLGMDLVVLDANDRHGLIVSSTSESVFSIRMTEYDKRIKANGDAASRVLQGLAHLGAATLAFPRPADLADSSYTGRITAEGVEQFIREAARRLDEAAAEAGEDVDPSADTPDLELAWRVYQRRASTPNSSDGRRVTSSTTGQAARALRFLADQGLLVNRSDEGGGTYSTTSRYRVQVREAGKRMFSDLLDLGITVITDGTGTLQIAWTSEDVETL